MFTTKLRIAALLVLTILILWAWRIVLPFGAYGGAAPAAELTKVPKEMLEKRLEEATMVWDINRRSVLRGMNPRPTDLFGWSERMLEAELPLLDKQKDRITALQKHVDRTREVENISFRLADLGVARIADAHTAAYERLNAEIRYFQEAGKIPPLAPLLIQNNLPEPKQEKLPPQPKKKEKP